MDTEQWRNIDIEQVTKHVILSVDKGLKEAAIGMACFSGAEPERILISILINQGRISGAPWIKDIGKSEWNISGGKYALDSKEQKFEYGPLKKKKNQEQGNPEQAGILSR